MLKKTLYILISLGIIFVSCLPVSKKENHKQDTSSTTVEQETDDEALEMEKEETAAPHNALNLYALTDQMANQNSLKKENDQLQWVAKETADIENLIPQSERQHIKVRYNTFKQLNGDYIIQFANDSSIVLLNRPQEEYETDGQNYRYVGEIDFSENVGYYLFEGFFWEGYACLMFDKRDGTLFTFPYIPIFDKNLEHFITYDRTPWGDAGTHIFLYDIIHSTESNEVEFNLSKTQFFDTLDFMKANWVADNKFLIQFENQDTSYLLTLPQKDKREFLKLEDWISKKWVQDSLTIDNPKVTWKKTTAEEAKLLSPKSREMHITKDVENFPTIDQVISLPLVNKDTIYLKNKSEEEYTDSKVDYKYVGQVHLNALTTYYIVSEYSYESFTYLLFNAESGEVEVSPSTPIFSPNLKHYISYTTNRREEFTKFYIYNIVDKAERRKGFEIAATRNFDKGYEVSVNWVDWSNILITVKEEGKQKQTRYLVTISE